VIGGVVENRPGSGRPPTESGRRLVPQQLECNSSRDSQEAARHPGSGRRCRWRIANRAAKTPERTVVAVIQPGQNPHPGQVHSRTMTRVTSNRSTLGRYGLGPSRRRTRVMPRSASDTGHDSGAANDTC
jgi:hypothetical protein